MNTDNKPVEVTYRDGRVFHDGWDVKAVLETWFGKDQIPDEYIPTWEEEEKEEEWEEEDNIAL